MALKPEEEKEAIGFITRFSGAIVSSLEDIALEYWWKTHPEVRNKFPYIKPFPGFAPYDDLIVGGLAVAPWVIGLLMEEDAKKKGDTKAEELGKSVRAFGEGGIDYSVPMILHRTVLEQVPWVPDIGSRSSASRQSSAAERRPSGRVIKL